MDGRHAARRSLEPVQGARAKARASRADDLVGASVLSLSLALFFFFSFSFLLALSRLSLSLAPTKRVLLARALFTPRTFPFIEGACYRLYAASPCVFLSAPSLSLRLSLSLAPRLFPHSLALSLSLSLVRARARGSQSTLLRSCTHFEALGFRPYVAVVSGNRRFGNTSRREQLLIDVILPAHFEHKGGEEATEKLFTLRHTRRPQPVTDCLVSRLPIRGSETPVVLPPSSPSLAPPPLPSSIRRHRRLVLRAARRAL